MISSSLLGFGGATSFACVFHSISRNHANYHHGSCLTSYSFACLSNVMTPSCGLEVRFRFTASLRFCGIYVAAAAAAAVPRLFMRACVH